MHSERTVLIANLGYNLTALEFEVSGQRNQFAHDREGAVLVKVWGGCRLGILYTFDVVMVDALASCARTSMLSVVVV